MESKKINDSSTMQNDIENDIKNEEIEESKETVVTNLPEDNQEEKKTDLEETIKEVETNETAPTLEESKVPLEDENVDTISNEENLKEETVPDTELLKSIETEFEEKSEELIKNAEEKITFDFNDEEVSLIDSIKNMTLKQELEKKREQEQAKEELEKAKTLEKEKETLETPLTNEEVKEPEETKVENVNEEKVEANSSQTSTPERTSTITFDINEEEVSIKDTLGDDLNKVKDEISLTDEIKKEINGESGKDNSSYLISKEENKKDKKHKKEKNSKKEKNNEGNKKINVKTLITLIILAYLDIFLFLGAYQVMNSRRSQYIIFIVLFIIIVNIIGIKTATNKVRPLKEKKQKLNVNVMNGVKDFDSSKHEYSFREYYNIDNNKNQNYNNVENEDYEDSNNSLENTVEASEDKVDLYANEQEIITASTRTILENELDKDITYDALAQDFKHYLNENGVDVTNKTLCNLIASMSSSKLIFIQTKDIFLASKVIKLLTEYLGTDYNPQKIDETWTSQTSLRWSVNDGKYVDSEFFKSFKDAITKRDKINIGILKGADVNDMDKYFANYLEYVNDPGFDITLDFSIPQVHLNESYQIPKNLWIFVFPSVIDKVVLNEKYVRGAVVLNINPKEIEPIPTNKPEQQVLSYQHFLELIYEDNQEKYVPEDVWKKIDTFEDELSRVCKFKIKNKLFIKMEKYLNAYYLCDGELEDGLDYVLNNVLLPVISYAKFKKLAEEDNESIMSIADGVFGLENIPACKDILQTISENNKQE